MSKLAAIQALRGEIAKIEARKPLTRAEGLFLMIRQAGGNIPCGCGCGEPLDPLGEGVIDEHQRALGLLGSNDLENRAWLRRPCAARKTKGDMERVTKARAQSGESKTAKKKPIHSRGFNKSLTRGFDGKVRQRRTRDDNGSAGEAERASSLTKPTTCTRTAAND